MDRYFVKLMLDQLKKGNKICNAFKEQAWKDMLTLFNGKFGSKYGKSFLKHRYKKLLKYYTDMKSLLEVKGFSWDEMQQKVAADDYVWDNYIKAHPDAHSYRKKTLVNYGDLKLIFGNAVSNGHCSHLWRGRNFEDDIIQIKTGEEKEGRTSADSECLRTNWTSTMDRYLIELLQDQVLRGNKIGHGFVAEAWIAMVRLFNAKFGSHYDKDALRNRYKHLRRQYNDIKVLLDQSGFSWDETGEMVTAEDYVWDSYTKVYPDARSYRNKSVPSYHKLCVIYGEEVCNGRYSISAYNADLDCEEPDLMIGSLMEDLPNLLLHGIQSLLDGLNLWFVIGEDIQCHANSGCSTTDWTPSMDRYLIDIMLEEVRKGKKIDHTLNNQAWIDMFMLFKERFSLQHDKDFLKCRSKSLEKQYFDMKNLLEQRQFSWDETQQMVTAFDDVWDAYVKEHPDAKSYRITPKPNYNDLCLIYGNPASDGWCNQARQDIGCNGARLNNSCHWRTDWTPSMDRFFIDLMLEQVRNGSMIDKKFNKLAWSDMVAEFSAEFGSQHDKDVLKSRFMNLRKRFNDMKTLLDQSVFAWNEMQQMINAEDNVWDAYVKVHPDARTYRNRTLPNFNDLFIIYGNDITEQRQDYSGHFMDAEDYELGVNSGLSLSLSISNIGEEDYQSPANNGPLRINWTRQMDRYFIDLMLEQLHRGNKIGRTYNMQAWTWMNASFSNKFGLLCDKDVLKDRYWSLRKEYMDVTDLLNHNGFAWDEIRQKVTADDFVWEAYIKEHPDAIAYRDKILDDYCDLCLIYGNESRNGRLSYSDIKMEINTNTLGMGIDDLIGDIQSPAMEFEISRQRRKRKSATSSTSACVQKVQRTIKEEIQEPCVIKTYLGTEEDKDYSSIECIVAALQTVPDMDDELFLEACELLEDERKAKMFVAMDITARRKWLLKKLRR
uniref:Myb/SANT-like domain-containing protein n=1 Tax=Fagus sylvatica TaxID=28930 RepID=A0A2N9HVL4_FAGSY